MRHFGNAHYGGWYKSNKSSHQRYYSFLGQLREAFDARGLYRKRNAVSAMRLNLNKGKTPEQAQKASKTPGYSPPLYSDFNSMWEESQDTPAIVEYFASGGEVAGTGDEGEFESVTTIPEMIQAGIASGGIQRQRLTPEENWLRLVEFQMKVSGSGDRAQAEARATQLMGTSSVPGYAEYAQKVSVGEVAGGTPVSLDEEGESFFQQYKTVLVLGGTAAVLGGGLWLASKKGWI